MLYAAACEQETDVALMLDSSASIGVSKFTTLKSVASGIIRLLNVEAGLVRVRVAVVTYASDADVDVHFDR